MPKAKKAATKRTAAKTHKGKKAKISKGHSAAKTKKPAHSAKAHRHHHHHKAAEEEHHHEKPAVASPAKKTRAPKKAKSSGRKKAANKK